MPVTFSTTSFPTGISPTEVITADLNNDGNLDLVTTYYSSYPSSSGFSVLLGNGAGQFSNPTNFSFGQIGSGFSSISLAAQDITSADINQDGKLDLLVASSGGLGSGFVSVLLGDGTGNFAPETNFAVDIEPGSLVVADFNQDGKPDVAVSGDGGYFSLSEKNRTIAVLLGDGTGQLSSPSNLLAGTVNSVSSGLATGDFNGDGIPDLAVHVFDASGGGTYGTNILLGNGAGSFSSAGIFQTLGGGSGVRLLVADFSSDGKLDIVSSGYQKGTGTGQLEESTYLYVDESTFADFNGDGKLDIAGTISVTRAEGASGSIGIVLGNGAGQFSFSQSVSSSKYARDMVAGDFNKDGKPDLAVVDGASLAILLNTTVGTNAIVFSDAFKAIDASSESSGSLNLNLGQKTLRLGTITQTINGDYDTVTGTRQADRIIGSKSADFLDGEAGNDVLLGLDGNDRLTGSRGSDTLTGGKGKDRFEFVSNASLNASDAVFNRSYGVDKITDFVLGQDKIILDRAVFTKLNKRISFSTVETLNEAKQSRSLIAYIQNTGKLYYNQNGAKPGFGIGGAFADLSNNLELSVRGFQIQ